MNEHTTNTLAKAGKISEYTRRRMTMDIDIKEGKVIERGLRPSQLAKMRYQGNTLKDQIEKDLINSEFNEEAEI